MNRRTFLIIITSLLIICALGAGFFVLGGLDLFNNQKKPEYSRTKIITPGETDLNTQLQYPAEYLINAESYRSKAPLGDGEEIISALTIDLNSDSIEEQIIAYHSIHEIESPVHVALNEYDERLKAYRRTWSAPASASGPGTAALFSRDMIGDRSVCILLSGMNNQGEQTMTIFRWSGQSGSKAGRRETTTEIDMPFVKIFELQIDGTIRIQETERSQAYQLGQAPGLSYTIAAYGHDSESANLLDQIELQYTYNPKNNMYERTKRTRIPGSQIEQRRLRELLSGTPGVFENFINDLWYYVSPEGTIDSKQYIYFDPANKEVIFYGDENLQVFTWKKSTPNRYGLYITSQNISVTTLSRSVTIELESLDSIRIRVFEEVRLKIGVNESWDGSYRRAGAERKTTASGEKSTKPPISAAFDSSMGKFRFLPGGTYELVSGNTMQTGWYVFFQINEQELLELRQDTGNTAWGTKSRNNGNRLIYLVHKLPKTGASRDILNLSRVRLGTTGIQDLHEGIITLTPAEG